MKKKERKKHPIRRMVLLFVLAVLVLAALVFVRFGGFGTGESASPEAFMACAGTVEDIAIPENVTIVALGEATHGNAEFQELKLSVFRHLVENYGVRALALEGDYGGCEAVNRYIHGGSGTAQEAAAAIGFAIYRTDEMAELISYMRQYNENAAVGDDLRFYGFDMQRCDHNVQFLAECCRALGVDSGELEQLVTADDWSDDYDLAARRDIITEVKIALTDQKNAEQAQHLADVLLQNCALQAGMDGATGDYAMLRDRYMADNTLWIAEQERAKGHSRIFVTAHNGHVARWASYDQMGKLLADEIKDDYYVIGTDFYKTTCNMPSGSSGRRTNQVFYSHDPLAKAADTAGLDTSYLDFARAAENPALAAATTDYVYMGSLGEGYSLLNRILPPSYRIFQPPAELYDGMIFVSEATPTKILDKAE